ncbi:uncharacterized protein FIESC28_10821 [Fusarium coffeatum]|uniref:NB-ARC domain-containing protein n=1 Tax=Fusarium coffeatum TaxID=231269 RepID=A0A366QSX8_9HYPO|nr:uncharacterized protein FIESC28_10821 [Fusarium coffeatum]RBR07075.1 hypothetical protein FIESC28_10821 [Fusarium coffeatum]
MAQALANGVREDKRQDVPFTTQLLSQGDRNQANNNLDPVLSLCPASYRTASYDLVPPSQDYSAWIASELNIQRLNKIHRWLWAAGTAVPPRPLHDQISTGREVVITEAMDMHLVWTTGIIYIKPLPRFLLEPTVWTRYLCCRDNCQCSVTDPGAPKECEQRKLYKTALGFLYSYAALLRHESDFHLAKDRYLLPNTGISWFDWIAFVKELNTEHIYQDINPRFHHKELRLSRLNHIYFFTQFTPGGFVRRWDRYSTFFHANLGWLTATTVYIVVVLTSMQNQRNRSPFDVLYDPQNDPNIAKPATVEYAPISCIIAVHGLGSDVDRTWTWRQSEEPVHWLKDANMLPKVVPTARIMAFNYDSTWMFDAPRTRVELCGEDLIRSMHNLRGHCDRPVVFLAHSFGGLVVQDGLIFADREREFQYIIKNTAGLVTLGTPSRGTRMYWIATLIARLTGLWGSHQENLSLLVYDSPQLRDKAQSLGRLSREVYPFPIVCFFELIQTMFIKSGFLSSFCRGFVVVEESACVSGSERLQLQTDHINLNKYWGPQDRSYLSVSGVIEKMCKNVGTVVNRQVPGDEPPPKGHWMVPFERNESFVGREDIMREILHRIPPGKFRDTCQQTVVEGLGGVGKTQIALEATFRLRKLNPGCSVFWVPAIDEIGFQNAYKRIAEFLGIDIPEGENASITARVKEALSSANVGEWLLVIDNADDPKLLFNPGCLASYLPSSPAGSIIFTTRTSEITTQLDAPSAGTFVIDAMSKEEATALMCTKLSASQMEETHSLDCLFKTLAYLPLALKQAASYMQKTKDTPTRYLHLCQSSDETFIKLLTKEFRDKTLSQDSDYGGQAETAVAKTWLISFKHVRRINPMAGDILEFLCFLSEKDIPLSILPPEYEDLKLNEAIGVLQSYAFITTREDGEFLDMHRLVRLATRNWLEETGRFVQAYDPVLLRLTNLLEKYQLEDRDRYTRFIPHAESVVSNNTRSNDLSARFKILLSFSIVLYAEHKNAFGFMKEAVRIGSNIFQESHTELMTARFFLADLLKKSGRAFEAKDLVQRNLQLSRETVGEEDPQTLRYAADYGHILQGSEPAEAERILQQTLQKQRQVLGEEHEDTVDTKGTLVDCLLKLSKYTEAEEMARQVLNAKPKDPGEAEIDNTNTMLRLSTALLHQSLYEEAEHLARRVYLKRERSIGTKGYFTRQCLDLLTVILFAAGKYQEAEEKSRLLLNLLESISEEETAEKINAMLIIGLCLAKRADFHEATGILRETMERCLRFYGKQHELTVLCGFADEGCKS